MNFPRVSDSAYSSQLGAFLMFFSLFSYSQGQENRHTDRYSHHKHSHPSLPLNTATLDTVGGTVNRILPYGWLHKNRNNAKKRNKQECSIGADSPLECLRPTPNMVFMDKGVPGVKNTLLSLETLMPTVYQSFFNPVVQNSIHSNGGLILPNNWELVPYNDFAIRETWTLPGIQDTPSTQMQWERGPFAMNIFHFKLNRLLSKQAYLVLDLFTESSKSEEYDYSPVVHQPYLSNFSNLTLGSIWKSFDRDSSNIVLEGVSQGTGALNFRPRIGWFLSPQSVLETYWEYYTNSSQGILPVGDTLDLGPITERVQQPFSSDFSSQNLGTVYRSQREYGNLSLGTKWGNYNKKNTAHTHQNHSAFFDLSTAPTQSFEGSVWEQFVEMEQEFEFWYHNFIMDFILLGGFHNYIEDVKGALFITNTLDSSYVEELRKGLEITKGHRDEQVVYSGIKWHWNRFRGKFIGQGYRISFMDNTREWVAGYNASLRWDWKEMSYNNIYLLGSLSQIPSVPHWQQLYVDNSLVLQTPNPGQHAGILERIQIQLGGGVSWMKGFISWNRLFGKNTLERMALPRRLGDTSTIEKALGYRQYHAKTWETFALGIHLSLGGWDATANYSQLLSNRFQLEDGGRIMENKELPNSVYKGYIQWQKSLISHRLLLTLKIDWEHFKERLAWQPQWDGTAETVSLEEFWVIDFQTQAKIQSFVLYYKVKNLNHDRYYIAPGDHPPGIQFRWGVNWSFRG